MEIMSKVRNAGWDIMSNGKKYLLEIRSKVIIIEYASLLMVLIKTYRNIIQTIIYCIINPRIFHQRNLPMSTFTSMSLSVSMDMGKFLQMFFDILSIRHFFRIRSKVIIIEYASLLMLLIKTYRNIIQTIIYCIINPRIFHWRNLPMSTFTSMSLSVSMDMGKFLQMFFDILSIRHFFHQSAFFPFDVFSIRSFLLFDLLSHSAFFPFAVLSHSTFRPIRRFVF